MVGILGASMNMIMRGPVTTMAEVTRRTVAENNMIASSRLAIVMSPVAQANGGDCDSDGYIEPFPYRDAGASPKPAGGGYLPSTIGASLTDPWQGEYGYCVWDHGPETVSDNIAGCGGTAARRLNGAPADTQIALAVISAGKDKVFQTSCNAYVDSNFDNIPDSPLLNKVSGADDIVLGYTYAEANNLGSDIWSLKTGDPNTATIGKDIEVTGDANVSGTLILQGGLVLPGDPGDNSLTGACSLANDQVLRRNTSTQPPTIEICDHAGGATVWEPIAATGAGGGNIQTEVGEQETLNGACTEIGRLARAADGTMLVCEGASISNVACTTFGTGAISFSSNGVMHVCKK